MERNERLGELVPCGGGDTIPLLKPKLLVGRRTSCDITLRFPNISSHHCEFAMINGYWQVQDLNSRNGIKVNGVRCSKKWLMPGDVVSIAKHRYEVSYEPLGDTPPPEDTDPFSVGLLEKAGLVSRTSPDRKTDEYQPDASPDDWEPEAGDDDPVMKWLSDESDSG